MAFARLNIKKKRVGAVSSLEEWNKRHSPAKNFAIPRTMGEGSGHSRKLKTINTRASGLCALTTRNALTHEADCKMKESKNEKRHRPKKCPKRFLISYINERKTKQMKYRRGGIVIQRGPFDLFFKRIT